MPGLLMIGTPFQIVLSIVLATIAASGLSVAFAGWLVRPLTAVERLAFALASLVTLWPTPVDAPAPPTLAARILGLPGLALITFGITAGTARPLPRATRTQDPGLRPLPYTRSPQQPNPPLNAGACA